LTVRIMLASVPTLPSYGNGAFPLWL
jgi:hypothetical protein